MSDILKAVEAGNVQAKEHERRTRARRRKWATRHFIRRLVWATLAMILFVILELCGLIAPVLAFILGSAVTMLAAVWLGAWLQFMFAEGGLLDVRIK